MAILVNPKHERMAQFLAQGMSAVDAHEQAGYKRHDGAASKVARSPDVRARVHELLSAVAETTGVTLEGLITECEEVRKLALQSNTLAVAIAAIKEKGILSGHRVKRSEQGKPGEFAFLDTMSAAELDAFAKGELVIPQTSGKPN